MSWRDYVQDNKEHSVVGTLKVLPGVWSPQLDNQRDILVYLPPSYHNGDQRYPVIYMQDGQNLFDRATSFAGEEWKVDETLEELSQEGLEAIAVGIPHAGEGRIAEYNPLAKPPRGRGEPYLAFVVETVKAIVDRDFRTRPDREHTGILGSSLGGLISLYAFFRYPEIFGYVGAISPALWIAQRAIYAYVRQAPFVSGKIYLDNGTHEGSARPVYDVLLDKGYRPGADILYVAEEGGRHQESAWARRLPGALRFLLRA